MKYGKLAKKEDVRNLRFADYLGDGLPAPAVEVDNFLRMAVGAGVSAGDEKLLVPMDGNDTLGCCTIAGVAHLLSVFRGLVGRGGIMAEADVVSLYLKLTGGADTGLVMLDVLKYWRANPIDGEKILAFAEIDPANHAHVQLGVEMFGAVYLGFTVQGGAVENFQAGRPWLSPDPPTQDGHCVILGRYQPAMPQLRVATWGGFENANWNWWRAVDEAYVVIPPEAAEPGFAPGFNFDALKADLDRVGRAPPA